MHTFPQSLVKLPQFDKLREFLRLLAALASISEPITTPDGLRKALTVILQVAQFLGLDQAFIDRVRTILADEHVFQIVLSIVQYLAGVLQLNRSQRDTRIRFEAVDGSVGTIIEAQDFIEWLPFVLQLVDLIQRILDLVQGRN
jgi:hypothetical protein